MQGCRPRGGIGQWPLHGTAAWGWAVWSSQGIVLHYVIWKSQRGCRVGPEAAPLLPMWVLQSTGSAAEAQQKPVNRSRTESAPATHKWPTPHGMNNSGLYQGLSSLDSVSPGRCRSAGAHTDLGEALNAAGEHQIQPVSYPMPCLCPCRAVLSNGQGGLPPSEGLFPLLWRLQ